MSEIILYTTADGKANIKLYAVNGTVWLTQAQMAELFNTTPQNITLHIKNIYSEGELLPEATCKDFLQVRTEGNRNIQRNQKFYNLDVIIAIGFRVRSPRGTQFRKWANTTLKEYLTKGFVLDSDRLKNPDGARITSRNYWRKSVTSAPAKSAFTRSCVICLPYLPIIALRMPIPKCFLHKRKTNCFLLLPVIPLPKL